MKILLFLSLTFVVLAHKKFRDHIPNGYKVPHPCNPNVIWEPVGHASTHMFHVVNEFGYDYHRLKSWTGELCHMDSDHDGKTNGQELGDPDCEWVYVPGLPIKTQKAPKYNATGHPGICEPLGSPLCAQERIQC